MNKKKQIRKLKARVQTLEATNVNLLSRLARLEKAVAGDNAAVAEVKRKVIDDKVEETAIAIGDQIMADIMEDTVRSLPVMVGLSCTLNDEDFPAPGPQSEIGKALEEVIREVELAPPPEPLYIDAFEDLLEGPCPTCPPIPPPGTVDITELQKPEMRYEFHKLLPSYDANGSPIPFGESPLPLSESPIPFGENPEISEDSW